MTHPRTGRLAGSASCLAIAAVLAHPVAAQENDSVFSLGTLFITGEKVARDLKDTASSVRLVTADEITGTAAGKASVQSIIAGTPNVLYTESVGTPIIRGQNSEGPHTGANAFFGGTVPRATINLDGHYLDYNELYFGTTSVWDVANIEVFRGPQTTSQGANAIGGAIIVNTKDPSFERETAYRVEYGNYNQKRASLMWSDALSEDFAARIAIDYSARDTFIDYVGTSFVQNDIGQDFESFNGRAKLLWQPSDIPGLEMKFTYSHTDTTSPSSEGASPNYEDLQSTTMFMPGWNQVTDTAVVDTEYDFGNGIVVSNQTQYSVAEIDRRVGAVNQGDADIGRKNLSNETTVAFGMPEDTISGMLGFYYAHTDQDDRLEQGGISTFVDERENLGLYGELNWRMDPRWTLTAGLRYQRDDISRSGDVAAAFANSDLDYDQSFENLLPKLSLAYAVTDDWTVGGLISKGYNPGGVSLDFVSSKDWESYEAETVWNYELFTRANLFDDKLFVTGNLFYMKYKNAQHNIIQNVGGTTYIHTINADKSEAYGLEVSADYRPTEALSLQASLGLLSTEITQFSDATSYVGNEFARAPGHMFSLGASWDVNDQLNVAGQLRYVDGYYSDTANSAGYAVDNYALFDLKASYRLSSGLEIYGFVNNVFDERAPVLKQAARGTVPFVQASMTAPRMFGIGLRGTF